MIKNIPRSLPGPVPPSLHGIKNDKMQGVSINQSVNQPIHQAMQSEQASQQSK